MSVSNGIVDIVWATNYYTFGLVNVNLRLKLKPKILIAHKTVKQPILTQSVFINISIL